MTDLRQAAQAVMDRWDSPKWEWSQQGPTADLMAVLRTALEQQAEPVALTLNSVPIGTKAPAFNGGAWTKTGHGWQWNSGSTFPRPGGDWDGRFILPSSPQQQAEPVAYFDFQELKFSWAKHMKIGPVPISIKVEPMKLYSEAAQRQWQGLTDEDMKDPKTHIFDFIYGARWAEAKLQERNSG